MRRLGCLSVNILGCLFVIVGFLLPWYSLNALPWYFSYASRLQTASGWQMWLDGRSTILTYAPHISPELFAFLWLFPLAALLTCALRVLELLFGKWNGCWQCLGAYAFLLLFMGIFLWPALLNPGVQFGLWLCLAGWILILAAPLVGFSVGGRNDTANKENFPLEQLTRRRMLSGMGSFLGLASLGTSGFLVWRNWRTHTALTIYRYRNSALPQASTESTPDLGGALSVDWSPNGKRIVVGRLDAPAQSWDALTAENIHTYQPARITAGIWSPDGQHIALADLVSSYTRTPIVVNATTGTQEAEAPFSAQSGNFRVQAMAWSPDSQSLAVGAPTSPFKAEQLGVQIWHPFTGEISRSYTLSANNEVGRVGTLAWSPNGQYLAANDFGFLANNAFSLSAGNSSVFIWNVQTGDLLVQHETVQYPLMDGPDGYGGKFLAWSPDSRHLAFANHTTVQIFELNSQKVLKTYSGHVSQVHALAYSPDGKYIASGGYDWTVQVWAAASGALRFLYQGHTTIVRDVAWSPDGKYIVSCSDDGTAQVWQPEF